MLIERWELFQLIGESRAGFLGEVVFVIVPRMDVYIFSYHPIIQILAKEERCKEEDTKLILIGQEGGCKVTRTRKNRACGD